MLGTFSLSAEATPMSSARVLLADIPPIYRPAELRNFSISHIYDKGRKFWESKNRFPLRFFQISKLHIPSFHMNQLACPTDIPSGADGCAKMHLEKGGSGARSKMGRAEGVNPHGTLVVYRRLGRIVCTPRKPQRPIFELQSRELARCTANVRRSSLQWDTSGKL